MLEILKVAVGWWFVGFAVMTLAWGFSPFRAVQIGMIGLIIAMLWIAVIVLPIEQNRRIFFEGPSPEDEQFWHIGCLHSIPLLMLFWAGVIFLARWTFFGL